MLRFGLLLGVLAATLAPAASPTPPPNVLLVVVDDLNTALGCYGDPLARTPNLDRLAARGVRFERAYCQYPLCNPSRASFLSGRRPETTGIYVLNTSVRSVLPDAVMLPQFFRRQGYYSAGAGKVFHSPKMNDQASWDRYEDGPGDDDQEKAAISSRYGGGDGRPAWHELDGDGSRTRDGLNAETIRREIATQSAAGRPFFLAAGFHKPHLPWTAPRRFFALHPLERFTPAPEPALQDVPPIALQTELSGFAQPDSRAAARRGYYACVSFMDEQLGRLLDELDRLRLTDRTLVVLLGDNGFHLGDHGGLWAKLSAFDQATHVPLILAGPGVPAGRVVTSPVELLDVYPTLADLAGLTPPPGLEGRSLRPFLAGAEPADAVARSLVFHFDTSSRKDVPGRTVVGRNWRYTEWEGGRAGREFYEQRTDAGEYVNLAARPGSAEAVRAAASALASGPEPKPGPANRPRALSPEATVR